MTRAKLWFCRAAVEVANRLPLQVETLEDRSVPAVTSFAANVPTIDLDAVDEAVTVTNTTGTLAITSSGNVTGAGANFTSVNKIVVTDSSILGGQQITFAGDAYTLSGGLTANGVETVQIDAAITATGTSAIDITAPQSVMVNQDLTAGAGGLAITGGKADLTTASIGVTVQIGAIVSTTNDGAIAVTGFGGKGDGIGSDNIGVFVFNGGSIIGTGSGTVTVTGNGGGRHCRASIQAPSSQVTDRST